MDYLTKCVQERRERERREEQEDRRKYLEENRRRIAEQDRIANEEKRLRLAQAATATPEKGEYRPRVTVSNEIDDYIRKTGLELQKLGHPAETSYQAYMDKGKGPKELYRPTDLRHTRPTTRDFARRHSLSRKDEQSVPGLRKHGSETDLHGTAPTKEELFREVSWGARYRPREMKHRRQASALKERSPSLDELNVRQASSGSRKVKRHGSAQQISKLENEYKQSSLPEARKRQRNIDVDYYDGMPFARTSLPGPPQTHYPEDVIVEYGAQEMIQDGEEEQQPKFRWKKKKTKNNDGTFGSSRHISREYAKQHVPRVVTENFVPPKNEGITMSERIRRRAFVENKRNLTLKMEYIRKENLNREQFFPIYPRHDYPTGGADFKKRFENYLSWTPNMDSSSDVLIPPPDRESENIINDIRKVATGMVQTGMHMGSVLWLNGVQHAYLLDILWENMREEPLGKRGQGKGDFNPRYKIKDLYPTDFEEMDYGDGDAAWNQPNFKIGNQLLLQIADTGPPPPTKDPVEAAGIERLPFKAFVLGDSVQVPHIGRVPHLINAILVGMVAEAELMKKIARDDPETREVFESRSGPFCGPFRKTGRASEITGRIREFQAAKREPLAQRYRILAACENEDEELGFDKVSPVMCGDLLKKFLNYIALIPRHMIPLFLWAGAVEDTIDQMQALRYASLHLPRENIPTLRYILAFLDFYYCNYYKMHQMNMDGLSTVIALRLFHNVDAKHSTQIVKLVETMIPMWRLLGSVSMNEVNEVRRAIPDNIANL